MAKFGMVCFHTSEDLKLITHIQFLRDLKEKGKKVGIEAGKEAGMEVVNEKCERFAEIHKRAYKDLCNNIRENIGSPNLVGLAFNKDKTGVGIFVFDKVAGIDDSYDILFDENKQPYIEIAD